MSTTNLKTFETIKKLKQNATSLKNSWSRFLKASGESNCDKHDFSFTNTDTRFASFTAKIYLTSYTGYYGSSSCSTYFNVDNNLATEALSEYLEAHKSTVLDWMGNYLDKKADGLVSKARKEIEEMNRFLDDATIANADKNE
jgi:uncharacterized protein YhdP